MKNKRKSQSFVNTDWNNKFKSWYFKPKKKYKNINFYLMFLSLMVALSLIIIVFSENDIKQQLSNYPWFWVVWVVFMLIFLYNAVRWIINLRTQRNKQNPKNDLKLDISYKSWQQKVYEAEIQAVKKQSFGSKKEKGKWWKR